ALPPALTPRSSTASLVIEEVMIWPPPISTRTCEVVAPFFTSTTVPLIWLRALMRMVVLSMPGTPRAVGCSIGIIPRAYGATAPDISAFLRSGETPLDERYCFASGAASTALQAGGSDAIVIGGFGGRGIFGGFGCSTASLNQ